MMSEVVDDFDAARLAAHFLPSCDSRKSFKRMVDLGFGLAIKTCRARGHGSVAHIEFADHRNFVCVVAEFETRSICRISGVANPLRTVLGETDLDHLC